MKKTLFLILLIFIGCSKPEHSIEIYLLKSRAKNKIGISAKEFLIKSKLDTSIISEIGRNSTYDTVKKKFIYAGEFDISEKNLQSKALLKHDEIEYIDFKTNRIKFSKSGAKKIKSLPGTHMRDGIQFVITDNKIPVFSGYFWNDFSSYGSNWNCISYTHNVDFLKPTEVLEHSIYKGEGMGSWRENGIKFSQYPEFVKALKESGKLKE